MRYLIAAHGISGDTAAAFATIATYSALGADPSVAAISGLMTLHNPKYRARLDPVLRLAGLSD